MKRLFQSMAMIMFLVALLAACGGEKYEPQPINEDTDKCAICNMAIKDDQYATQIVTKDGQSLKFDDLGDMHTWMERHGTDSIGAAFVRDYHGLQWIRYEKAYYVYDPSFHTPMAYGVVSFESEEDARAFIEQMGTGKLMTAEDLKQHDWQSGHSHGHEHGGDLEHSHDDHDDHGGHGEGESAEAHDQHAAGGHGGGEILRMWPSGR